MQVVRQNRGYRMTASTALNVVTAGTMMPTVHLLNEPRGISNVIIMTSHRRIEEIFDENSLGDIHLNFTRQINLEYLQTVYNRREHIGFGEDPSGQIYLYISALGMMLPIEVLNISPNEFSGRMAAEISEFLEVMHATVLINSFSESYQRPAQHVVDFDKLDHKRYKKAYKNDFDMCTICQENFKSNEKIVILHNEHGFHRDCIKPWLQQKPCCPNCKAIVQHKLQDVGSGGMSFDV